MLQLRRRRDLVLGSMALYRPLPLHIWGSRAEAAGTPKWISRKALASQFGVWRWRLVCPPAPHTLGKVSKRWELYIVFVSK